MNSDWAYPLIHDWQAGHLRLFKGNRLSKENQSNILLKGFYSGDFLLSDFVESSNIHWLNKVLKGCDFFLQDVSAHLMTQVSPSEKELHTTH